MSIFDDILKLDAQFAFIDADGFGGESVTYTPKGGTPRTINAQVIRHPPQLFEGNVVSPFLEVTVANDSTYGISSSEIDYGGDTIAVNQRQGNSATRKTFNIRQPSDGQPNEDAGMVRIELR